MIMKIKKYNNKIMHCHAITISRWISNLFFGRLLEFLSNLIRQSFRDIPSPNIFLS